MGQVSPGQPWPGPSTRSFWRLRSAGTLLLVAGGSAYKTAQLRGGGRIVAEHLGGRRLNPDTVVPSERQLLNVVEEMAIAAGTSVPPVYLLEEEGGINAFAAGYSLDDAVIGITRGTIERLSRDELQGVVAQRVLATCSTEICVSICA